MRNGRSLSVDDGDHSGVLEANDPKRPQWPFGSADVIALQRTANYTSYVPTPFPQRPHTSIRSSLQVVI